MSHGNHFESSTHTQRLITMNKQSTAVHHQGIIATKIIVLIERIRIWDTQLSMRDSQTGKQISNSRHVHRFSKKRGFRMVKSRPYR